jgi:hypothetical protein
VIQWPNIGAAEVSGRPAGSRRSDTAATVKATTGDTVNAVCGPLTLPVARLVSLMNPEMASTDEAHVRQYAENVTEILISGLSLSS